MATRDIITDLTDLSCPLPEDREEYEQNLRLSWEHIDGYDPLLNAIEAARSAMLQAEARIRLLVAYGREYVHPRPYRLEDLARAAGMSISGVRTAYGEDEVAEVARLTGARPRPRRVEGKTKVIEDAGGGEVLIRSKDDITAGDGAKHDVLDGKAAEAIGPGVKAGALVSEGPIRESRYAGISPELIAQLRSRTVSAFELIEKAWKECGVPGRLAGRHQDLRAQIMPAQGLDISERKC
jgi:hypothetical protein